MNARGRFAALALGFVLEVAAGAQSTVVLSDGEFAAGWTTVGSVSPLLYSSARAETGGNPGASWRITHSALNAPGLRTWHFQSAIRYDPAVQGPLESLSFAFDHTWPAYRNTAFSLLQPALRQDGVIYLLNTLYFALPNPFWQRYAASGLVAAEFVSNTLSRPDFSGSGAPIELGLSVFSQRHAGDPGGAIEQRFDNFLVSAVTTSSVPAVAFQTANASFDPVPSRWTTMREVADSGSRLFLLPLRLNRALPEDVEVVVTIDEPSGGGVARFAPGVSKADAEILIDVPPFAGHLRSRAALVPPSGLAPGDPPELDLVLVHSLPTPPSPTYGSEDAREDCLECIGAAIACVVLPGSCNPYGLMEVCSRAIEWYYGFGSQGNLLIETGGGGVDATMGAQIAVLRRVRDELLESAPAGRYYAELYRTLSPEMGRILVSRPSLAVDLFAMQAPWIDGFAALLGGSGSAFTVTPAMQNDLLAMLDRVMESGSDSFRRTLAFERERLGLDELAGRTMGELWQRVQEEGGAVACSPSPTNLCLEGGRYRVEVDWRKPNGERGAGRAVALSGDSGYFWFFDEANIETVVKVLNGCGTNGERWVFSAGLTNLEVAVTVTDTESGYGRRYFNPQGSAYPPKLDIEFQGCAVAESARSRPRPMPRVPREGSPGLRTTAGEGSGCVASPTALCLLDGRFRVEGTWRTADGRTGAANAAPLTPDTGTFWFFEPEILETVVKMVDGCGLNQRFWLYAAGLTNVEWLWTVTDTETGAVREFANPLGTSFEPVQRIDAFAGCP